MSYRPFTAMLVWSVFFQFYQKVCLLLLLCMHISLIFYIHDVAGSIIITLSQSVCRVQQWKNFENQSIIGKDMDKSKVALFWPTRHFWELCLRSAFALRVYGSMDGLMLIVMMSQRSMGLGHWSVSAATNAARATTRRTLAPFCTDMNWSTRRVVGQSTDVTSAALDSWRSTRWKNTSDSVMSTTDRFPAPSVTSPQSVSHSDFTYLLSQLPLLSSVMPASLFSESNSTQFFTY